MPSRDRDFRESAVARTRQIGEDVNDLKNMCREQDMSFIAGLLRGVEETLLVAHNMLKDSELTEL